MIFLRASILTHQTACLNNNNNKFCPLLRSFYLAANFFWPTFERRKIPIERGGLISARFLSLKNTSVYFLTNHESTYDTMPFFLLLLLSAPPVTFFSLIHIYVGLIHTMELGKLKPRSNFFISSQAFCLVRLAFQPTPPGRTACEYGGEKKKSGMVRLPVVGKGKRNHFLPHTLTVDSGYLSPTSNTLLPQSLPRSLYLFHIKALPV